jgi:hypothetical protein
VGDGALMLTALVFLAALAVIVYLIRRVIDPAPEP